MNDAQLIAEGRKYARTISRAQIKLGRLALQFAPIGDQAVHTGRYDRVQEYADAIGLPFGTVLGYRAVAHAWEGHRVDDMHWTTLKTLAPVQAKKTMLDLLRKKEPPTKSGRWTADAALALARRHGLWAPQERGNSDDLVIRRAAALSDDIGRLVDRVGNHELTLDERAALAQALEAIDEQLNRLRERLAPVGIDDAIGERRRDRAFMERIRQSDDNRDILERLA